VLENMDVASAIPGKTHRIFEGATLF